MQSQRIAENLYLLQPEEFVDNRGVFFRFFEEGIFNLINDHKSTKIPQISFSKNPLKNTVRGLHFQKAPFSETKLLYVNYGKIIDVVLNIDPKSEEFGKVYQFRLGCDERKFLLIGPNYAHGFITMAENTEVIYCINEEYCPEAASGVNFFDRNLSIQFPSDLNIDQAIISQKDRNLKNFDEVKCEL